MQAVIYGWKKDLMINELKDCENISKELALNGFDVYTGGGSGFMKAGNKGCYEINKNKTHAITVNSIHSKEGQVNNFYKKENLVICVIFTEKKKKLAENMDLYIFFPGGIGTLDEFTELINLFKTKEMQSKPIILYGHKYWTSLKSWFEFNNLNFPNNYVYNIINSVTEFKKNYNELFTKKQIVKFSSSSEYNSIKSQENENEQFKDDNGIINDLINSIFNDTMFIDELSKFIKINNDDKSNINNEENENNEHNENNYENDFNDEDEHESNNSEISIEIIILDKKSYESQNNNYDIASLNDGDSDSDSN